MNGQITTQLCQMTGLLRIRKELVAQWICTQGNVESKKRALRRLIARCAGLRSELKDLGYNPRQHYFTMSQALAVNHWLVGDLCPESALQALQEASIHQIIQKQT